MSETLESLRGSFNRSLRVEGKADRTLVHQVAKEWTVGAYYATRLARDMAARGYLVTGLDPEPDMAAAMALRMGR